MLRTVLSMLSAVMILHATAAAVVAQSGSVKFDSAEELFFFQPETPEQIVEAIEIADRIGRPSVAQKLMRQLVAPLPTTADLIALRKRFGIGLFVDLYTRPHLQPEAKQLLTAINEASIQAAPSAFRIEQLLQEPGDNTKSRAEAVLEILVAGDEAVPVLLAAEQGTEAGSFANAILTQHARDLRAGLLNQLATVDDATRVRILRLLRLTADPTLTDRLLRWQFGKNVDRSVADEAGETIAVLSQSAGTPDSGESAARHLSTRIAQLMKSASTRFGTQDIPADQSRFPTDAERAASLQQASLLADDFAVISDDAEQAAALQLVTGLATGQGVQDSATIESHTVEAALKLALQTRNHTAAVAALQIMDAQFNSSEPTTPNHTLLIAALADRDPRTRIMAAGLLARSGQSQSAVGAVRRQAEAVIAGSLLPEAVIIDPRATERIDVTTVLTAAGFSAVASATGVGGFELAANQLQCELVLVHSNCQQWPLSELIANLRADSRTGGVPIVVYGPMGARDSVRRLARIYEGVWFIEAPVTELTLFQALALLRVPGPILSQDDRQQLKSMQPVFEGAAAGL
jgi:hypothetical protein